MENDDVEKKRYYHVNKEKIQKDPDTIVEILKLHEKIEIRNYAKNGNNNMTELDKERIKVYIKMFIINKSFVRYFN